MAENTPIPKLYYFPTSYYSQKVLLALDEKGIKYDKHLLDMVNWEQYGPWYMKINPLGQMPCMAHGDKIIPDSKAITEYLDDNFDGPILIPKEHKNEINKLIGLLDSVRIPILTYGATKNPELQKNPSMPFLMRTIMKNRSGDTEPILTRNMKESEDDPELQKAYKAKLACLEVKPENLNKENVMKHIEKAKEVMDEIEKHLETNSKDPSKKNAWLFTDTFTSADIALAVFIHRMVFVGLAEEIVNPRPHLAKYKQRLYDEKDNFRKVCVEMVGLAPLIRKTMLKQAMKVACPFVVGGVAVGLGLWFLTK